MDVPQREPCATCAEPVAVEARVCPYCGHSALVELRLAAPVADGRLRYQVARALTALGAPYPAVGALQKVMAEPRPRLATGLTRAKAQAGQAALDAAGLQGQLAPAPAPGGAGLKVAGGVALGVTAATLVTWLALRPAPAAPEKREQPVLAAQAGGAVASLAGGAPSTELGRNELARVALASTVSLRCADSVGAGFFVGEGVLLTNAHVLCRDGSPLKVMTADKREGTGVPSRSDQDLDLALVNVSGLSAPPLALGDAGALDVGDRVLMVGSPVGMDFTVHEGMVSTMGRVILGIAYIQLDAKVNPGNSGGPLLDTRGRAVGIVSMKRSDAEGIALALPINYAWTGGGSALLDAPAGLSSSFDALLARADDEDRALAGKLASETMRPLLGGVAVNPDRQVMAQILRPARSQPYYEEFSFKVWSGTTEICSMTASVGDWRQVDAPQAGSRSNARVQAWLQKHGLSAQLYTGDAPLRLDLCPRDQLRPGVQLELQGAEPNASRVILY